MLRKIQKFGLKILIKKCFIYAIVYYLYYILPDLLMRRHPM